MDLERLIAAEERNEARLAAARAEAAALVAAAQAEAAARDAAHRDAVTRALAEMEQALAGERERRMAQLASQVRAEQARYDGITDAAIAAVVPDLVRRLVGREGA